MSGSWVKDCKRILDHMKELEDIREQDRLDMVRTISFILHALQRSVSGWMEWVSNPDVMATFSLEELEEVSKNLTKLTQPFIEYDCKVTSTAQRDLAKRDPETESESMKKREEREDIFYIN